MTAGYEPAPPLLEESPLLPFLHAPLTRRALLAAGVGIIVGGAAAQAEAKFGLISQSLEPDIDSIVSNVPPQLAGLDIPQTNEHYKTPLAAIRDGLNQAEAAGIKPFYRRPEYYLSTPAFLNSYLRQLSPRSGFGKWVTPYGTPYYNAVEFSRSNLATPNDLFDLDPGTTSGMLAAKAIDDPDIVVPMKPYSNTPFEAEALVAGIYGTEFKRMTGLMSAKGAGERVSTSLLLSQYLQETTGDIVQSLWNTTLFLKLASRLDTDKLLVPGYFESPTTDSFFHPDDDIDLASRKGAELLSGLFYDDFSKQVPLEWLLSAVSPTDLTLNGSDPENLQSYKDYMPVNRDGSWYHVYNIAAMAAFMDPSLVQELLVDYYRDATYAPRQGRIKTETDLTAINQVREIRTIFERYRVL